MLCEHHDVLGKRVRGAQELVDGPGHGEFVEPAESRDDSLPDVFSISAVFGDLEGLIVADLLDADEHAVSQGLTHGL